ncbi:MAG: metallophosphoesterase [Promethearchaeota archaeon]
MAPENQFKNNFSQFRNKRVPSDLEQLKIYLNSISQLLTGANAIVPIEFAPVLFVGDIHGFIDNLFYAIELAEKNEVSTLVFLGDYPDRGDAQLETLLNVIYLYMRSFCRSKSRKPLERPDFIDERIPDNPPFKVIALRGNHEDLVMNRIYGFKDFIEDIYGLGTFPKNELNNIYESLPIATITNWGTCGLHGGIPSIPSNSSLKINDIFNQLKNLTIPLNMKIDFKAEPLLLEKIILQILWNDPVEDNFDEPKFYDSFRGPGIYNFNKVAFIKFLNELGLKRLVRAHESSRGAYQALWDDRLIHIFSAFPYFGSVHTPAFYLEFEDGSGHIINHKNKTLLNIKKL